MQLSVSLSIAELTQLLDELAPIRIHFTKTDEDRRWIQFEKPHHVELVEGSGLRFESQGTLYYELIPKVPLPITISSLHVLITPKVRESSGAGIELGIDLSVQHADLKYIPDLVDSAIVGAINRVIDSRAAGLFWKVSDTLTASFRFPLSIEPIMSLEIVPRTARLRLGSDAIELEVLVGAGMARSKPAPTDDRPSRPSGA